MRFYYKAAVVFLCLLALSVLLGLVCVRYSYSDLQLLPASGSRLPWQNIVITDKAQGGESSIKMKDEKYSIGFDFFISKKIDYPRVAAQLQFLDSNGKPNYVDLSKYDTMSFNVKCEPANTLYVGVMTFDDKITVVGDDSTHRSPETYFSCEQSWSSRSVDLTHLVVPEWWLYWVNHDISNRGYSLEKVLKISIGSSSQSPVHIASYVQINQLVLSGRDWRWIYFFLVILAVIWLGYGYYVFMRLSQLKQMHQSPPSLVYRQLSVEAHRDREKNVVIEYLATQYSNPELDYEMMATAVGVGKTKINEILKVELGCTFSVYLNKLRLTEAARLLEQQQLTIAEVAYAVGYKNVSYFNKLFKEEYHCTPKEYKNSFKN